MTDECDSSHLLFKSRIKLEPDENDAVVAKTSPVLQAPVVVQRVSKAAPSVPRVVSVKSRAQSPKKIEKIALNLKKQQEKKKFELKSTSRGLRECRQTLYNSLHSDAECAQDDSISSLNWLNSFDLSCTGLVPLSPPLSPREDDEADGCFHRLRIAKPVHQDPTAKPPYTFSCLIFLAIESSYKKRLSIKEINEWVLENIAYYKNVPSGSWKNSIRFNLSSNQCFSKVDKNLLTMRDFSGKGSLWCINPIYRPMLIESLYRVGTNYERLNTIACLKDVSESPRSDINSRASRISQSKPAVLNPNLKILSKSSSQRSLSVVKKESNVCSDMDAVNALLSMKTRASSLPAVSKGRRKQLLKPPTKRTEDDEDSEEDFVDELNASDCDFEARDEDSADELHIDESVCESETGSDKRKSFNDDDNEDNVEKVDTKKKIKNESQMNPLLELSRAAFILEEDHD